MSIYFFYIGILYKHGRKQHDGVEFKRIFLRVLSKFRSTR